MDELPRGKMLLWYDFNLKNLYKLISTFQFTHGCIDTRLNYVTHANTSS